MTDFITILVLALILFGAGYYIYSEKKKGKKCIGCPHSKECGDNKKCCK